MKFRVIFSLIMSLILSFLMSAWVTYINLGLGPDYISHWLNAFFLAWPAAATIAFVFSPKAQKLSHYIAQKV